MTEEIEKQAEEYTRNCCVDMTFDIHNVRKAFQDGAKWGIANAIEWHDLRKNPNDLPKLESEIYSWSITVANQLGEACHYNYRKSCWETPLFTEIEGVIAWCELPKYKE